MIGLATNVLVRYLTRDDPPQSPRAFRLVTERCTRDQPGLINVIVLCELVWVLETRFRYHRPVIAELLDKLLWATEFEIEDAEAVAAALQQYRRGKVDFADALIGRRNRNLGCTGTATFDRAAAAARRLLCRLNGASPVIRNPALPPSHHKPFAGNHTPSGLVGFKRISCSYMRRKRRPRPCPAP